MSVLMRCPRLLCLDMRMCPQHQQQQQQRPPLPLPLPCSDEAERRLLLRASAGAVERRLRRAQQRSLWSLVNARLRAEVGRLVVAEEEIEMLDT